MCAGKARAVWLSFFLSRRRRSCFCWHPLAASLALTFQSAVCSGLCLFPFCVLLCFDGCLYCACLLRRLVGCYLPYRYTYTTSVFA